MSTVTAPAAPRNASSPDRGAPSRTVRLQTSAHGHRVMTITEVKGRRTLATAYHLEEVDAGMGRRGFRLSKVERSTGTDTTPEADAYHVVTSREGVACECKGFLRWGHCKHSSALVAAERAGKLG